MSEALEIALISTCVSLVGSLITLAIARHGFRTERHKLEKELQRKFTERLYDLRIKSYPKAFEITENIGKLNAVPPEEMANLYAEIRRDLRAWHTAEVAFLLSDESYPAYRELEIRLKKNPKFGTKYSEEQVLNLWNARQNFRAALRRDVGLLFDEDKRLDSSD